MLRNRPRETRNPAADVVPCGSGADVAQLVEQSIRNRQVIGSSPIVGSSFSITSTTLSCRYSPIGHQLVTTDVRTRAVEGVDPVLLPSREPVRVPLERRRRLRVSELGRDVGDGGALSEQLSCEGMPEIVEAEAGKLCGLEHPAPRLRDIGEIERRSSLRAEDPRGHPRLRVSAARSERSRWSPVGSPTLMSTVLGTSAPSASCTPPGRVGTMVPSPLGMGAQKTGQGAPQRAPPCTRTIGESLGSAGCTVYSAGCTVYSAASSNSSNSLTV